LIVYLDTSAFVKLVLDERGSEDARAWFSRTSRAASSVITYPEACSALRRRESAQGSAEGSLADWIVELDDRWRRCAHVAVGEKTAGRLAIAHGLRGMDAVQLAAAMALRERVRADAPAGEVLFAAFDARLLEAARREGFATLGGPLA